MRRRAFKMMLILLVIGGLSAFFLSLIANYAYPLIEENRRIALQKAILEVLPQAKRYEVISKTDKIYQGLTESGNLAGYAFVGQGGGYQGIIKIMIGISPNWETLRGISILENVETPGLGAKITTPEFGKQFEGLKVDPQIEYVQNKPPQKPNQIQAITGATISSQAVVNIMNNAIDRVRKQIQQKGTTE